MNVDPYVVAAVAVALAVLAFRGRIRALLWRPTMRKNPFKPGDIVAEIETDGTLNRLHYKVLAVHGHAVWARWARDDLLMGGGHRSFGAHELTKVG